MLCVARFNLKPIHKNMNSRYEEVKQLVENLQEDFDKFYNKDIKAAGTRIRKGMQNLKEVAQAIRKEVQDMKNAK